MLYQLLNIDVKTLISVLFWGSLTSISLICSYQISSQHATDRKLSKYFLWAKVFQAFSYFLLYFRGEIKDIFSVNLGNTFLLLGFYLEALAILTIVHQDSKKLHTVMKVILALSILTFNLIEFIKPASSLRVSLSSFSVFSIILIPSLKLLLSKNITRFKRIIGVYYIFFLILLLPRGIYTLFRPETNIFTNFFIQILTFLSLVLLMMFSLSAYSLLMKENTDKVINSMATTDYLTGMANRYYFLDTAGTIFRHSIYNQTSVNILFLDIDYFKRVNDTYGHSFGDDVLIRLAQIIRNNLRENDLSCRYGGEEFVVFIPHLDLTNSIKIAERIMNEIREATFENNPDFRFTISIGLVNGVPNSEDSIMKYIDKADQALYEAKNTGRNKIVKYEL